MGACRFLTLFCIGWVGLVGAGLAILWRFENTPGLTESSPAIWPRESSIDRNIHVPILLMFAHPHCSCSRASLSELSKLMASAKDNVDTRVLFYAPESMSEEWITDELWQSAMSIPGITVQVDRAGKEAQHFHVTTSGHVALYDTEGQLLFSGGITPSRGHEGDNRGRTAILQILRTGQSTEQHSFVFGCELIGQSKTRS